MRLELTAIRSQISSLTSTLASIKPVPTWAARALDARAVELREAYKAKDPLRVANAKRGIDSLRVKVGLEARVELPSEGKDPWLD
jgi:hypothetical protein